MKPEQRPEKNSERMEIRLPYTVKTRFLEACKRAGDTPSHVLRNAMQAYAETIEAAERQQLKQDLTMKLIKNPLKVTSMLAASVATAFFFVSTPSMADNALFDTFDKDKDGQLTKVDLPKEIKTILAALDDDKSGSITRDEFQAQTEFPLVSLTAPLDEIAPIQNDGTVTLSSESVGNATISLISIDMSEAGRIVISREQISQDEFESLESTKIVIEGSAIAMKDR